MAKRLGMGEKKKKPEDLTELERFLQLNRQVKRNTTQGSPPGSRGASTQIEHTGWPEGWWPVQDYDPIEPDRGRPSGRVGSRDEAGLLPTVPQTQDQFMYESDMARMKEFNSPYQKAVRQMFADEEAAAADEAAAAEAADLAAKEKAYNEGRIYGSYQEDIGAKRQRYMDALKEIQSNSRRLNMIAGLTGGTSQADSFTKAALDRLEKMEEFNDDERLHQIRTGVYYDQNGNWHPPKSKKEAYNRAIQFGASAAEAAHISGGEPEEATFVNWQYTSKDGNAPFGKVISVRRGEGVGDQPNPEGWVKTQGYQGESYTDATAHTNQIQKFISVGNIPKAIESDVLWRMARERKMELSVATRIATDLIWNLIPTEERHEEVISADEWGKNEDEIERELWNQGRRYVKVGSPDGSWQLVALEEPIEIEGVIEEAEEEDTWIPKSVRESRFYGG